MSSKKEESNKNINKKELSNYNNSNLIYNSNTGDSSKIINIDLKNNSYSISEIKNYNDYNENYNNNNNENYSTNYLNNNSLKKDIKNKILNNENNNNFSFINEENDNNIYNNNNINNNYNISKSLTEKKDKKINIPHLDYKKFIQNNNNNSNNKNPNNNFSNSEEKNYYPFLTVRNDADINSPVGKQNEIIKRKLSLSNLSYLKKQNPNYIRHSFTTPKKLDANLIKKLNYPDNSSSRENSINRSKSFVSCNKFNNLFNNNLMGLNYKLHMIENSNLSLSDLRNSWKNKSFNDYEKNIFEDNINNVNYDNNYNIQNIKKNEIINNENKNNKNNNNIKVDNNNNKKNKKGFELLINKTKKKYDIKNK